ncbi:MAG: hydroxyacid dehydrogenase, partial [Ponticaulis sp.]|nr:hydroxyacid dehydrogenase [Ponticaulis sp.]
MDKSATVLPTSFLKEARDILGTKGVSVAAEELEPHLEDWRGNYKGYSPALLKPASTEEVSETVKLCARHGVAITPQGGNTGLVNGGLAHGEIVLSLTRMNSVRSVDALNNSLIADAGTPLTTVHEAAENADRFFPLSLGSQGTATIGGLTSTNAGGVAVLRYGMMRDLLLGLEVVTPSGDVWSNLKGLRKDNTGYDLKHLFAGAEGTLGVITGACLKLFPVPQTSTAWLCLEKAEDALQLLSLFRKSAGDTVTSFELMMKSGVELACKEISACRDPLPNEAPWRILVELSFARDDLAQQGMETALE